MYGRGNKVMNQISAVIIMILIGMFSVVRTVIDIKNNKWMIFTNILFGGSLFTIINLLGFSTTLNILTGTIITLYGAMGVVLIVVLKLIFNII